MIDSTNKLSSIKQCELLEISCRNLFYKKKEEPQKDLNVIKLLAPQYYVTPFYGCDDLNPEFTVPQHSFIFFITL